MHFQHSNDRVLNDTQRSNEGSSTNATISYLKANSNKKFIISKKSINKTYKLKNNIKNIDKLVKI